MNKMSRREFATALGLTGLWSATRLYGIAPSGLKTLVRVGFVSDSHYANFTNDWCDRFNSGSCGLMKLAAAKFNELKLDMAFEGGDLIDPSTENGQAGGKKDMAKTVAALDEIEAAFTGFKGPCYHIIGNHDCTFRMPEFFEHVKNDGKKMTSSFYAFEQKGVKFIVLDANVMKNGVHYSPDVRWGWMDSVVPPEQLDFLKRELDAAKVPCVVCCHELLHPKSDWGHIVKNAAEVREIIEKSGKVKTVLMGHYHEGSCMTHNGILYYAIAAQCRESVTTNSFAEIDILEDGSAVITGYELARSYNPSHPGLTAIVRH